MEIHAILGLSGGTTFGLISKDPDRVQPLIEWERISGGKQISPANLVSAYKPRQQLAGARGGIVKDYKSCPGGTTYR